MGSYEDDIASVKNDIYLTSAERKKKCDAINKIWRTGHYTQLDLAIAADEHAKRMSRYNDDSDDDYDYQGVHKQSGYLHSYGD